MPAASVEVTGPNGISSAQELRAHLAAAAGEDESVSPVQVDRSAELVIAVIGLIFSGVGTAKTLWDWWHPHRSEATTVRVVWDDGTSLDLSGVDSRQLELEFERRSRPER